jgi:hypothetical protein
MKIPLALLACFLALNTVSIANPAAAAPSTMALADCVGKPTIKPVSVTLACADANFTAGNLTWTGWGNAFAAAMGTATVNDCTPSCVAGHFHHYKIILIANGTQRCPSGQPAYARITYAWVGRGPGTPDNDPTYPVRCGNR